MDFKADSGVFSTEGDTVVVENTAGDTIRIAKSDIDRFIENLKLIVFLSE